MRVLTRLFRINRAYLKMCAVNFLCKPDINSVHLSISVALVVGVECALMRDIKQLVGSEEK